MPKHKTIIEVQQELENVLILKYAGSEAVTVKRQCGHVAKTKTAHLRKGSRCGKCSGNAPKSVLEYQAEVGDDLLVLKVEDSRNITVKGACGHVWTAQAGALRAGHRCGECSPNAPKGVLGYQAEFNDLLILKVENAKAVTVKSPICGHVWMAEAGHLRAGQRCAKCADYGYNPSKPAWLYLMERPGEMQIGITNVPDQRLATHAREGWQLVEMVGPRSGQEILDRETAIKKHLKTNDLLVDGTHENWLSSVWSPHSLAAIEQAARQLVAA